MFSAVVKLLRSMLSPTSLVILIPMKSKTATTTSVITIPERLFWPFLFCNTCIVMGFFGKVVYKNNPDIASFPM